MSFPDREQRKVCWDSRDRYWDCLDDQNIKDSSLKPKACAELRRVFEKSCPTQWVTHFDRKRDFNVFKERMKTEGFDPIKDETKTKHKKNTGEYVKHWNNITATLIKHLATGLTKMDDQLLCATCIFSTVTLTDRPESYLDKIKEMIDYEVSLRSQDIKEGLNTLQVVSLIYGMFQSSFLISKDSDQSRIPELLSSSFNLLVLMGNEYSQYTYTVFKTMNSFKKIVGTEFQDTIFSKENQITLLNLVNHNWENPITGVRDLNRGIFQTLIANIDDVLLKSIIVEINAFYWNKAKYLMLTVVIESSHQNISKLLFENKWDEGLIDNLHKPGLVSALTDMYFSVLGKIQSPDQWCEIFLHHILKILNGSSSRAIENFNNYWLLTTLKKFPQLLDILIGEMEKFNETEQRLHSILFLVKQGSKIGITSNIYEARSSKSEKLLTSGLEHYNTQIRMLAFDILCIPQHKTMPSQIKYSLILQYLQNNINSDCTVLRISMLKSFDHFMGELHIAFRSTKDNQNAIDHLMNFCKNIQELIVFSLNSNGNYQRKITSIKVANTFIGCLSEIPKKRRQQIRDSNIILIDFMKDNKNWILHNENFVMKLISLMKDPSDDIRVNVTALLLLHYHAELRRSKLENKYFSIIVEEALLCMKSKFFYDVSCGQSMYNLLVNLLLKEKREDTIFKSVENVFYFGYNELMAEYALKRDIPKTIEDGKQLHSFISILQVVLEACLTNSKKFVIPNETMVDLLDSLQDIANQFSWEQSHSTLSDFSEMSDMVENIIEKSGHRSSDEKDESKISGLHQMVLNCLWHNTSCQLASLLIQYNTEDVEKCSKCLMIITHVLETSRHKGAIEAAGVALESKTSTLPQTLLKSKLHMLISEASKMASITRRGAGLSIMVHRIVSSDMRKGKPLFHYFMNTILDTCKTTEDIPNAQDVTNIENQMDLPKAILIHFLTKIVTDSSLASDMINAALQLYGALVQKLVGQKKASGTDDETIATVACDELRTHSPKLWSYITQQLRNENDSYKIESHSNLMPILNMLANSAKRYNFSSDLLHQEASDKELLTSLVAILDSPIHTVRRLTAKCIFNIFPFELIYDVLVNMKFQSENLLHGALLLFKLCYQYYQSNRVFKIKYLEERFRAMLESRQHSYWSREVFESTVSINITFIDLETIFSEAASNWNALGMAIWLKTCIQRCIQNCSWEDMPKYLGTLLTHSDYECYCEFLFEKLENDSQIPKEVLIEIANILLSFENKYNSNLTWKILYEISLKVELTNVDLAELITKLQVSYKLRYIIPFTARALGTTAQQQKVLQNMIFKLSDFETADFDMRYIAVLANNEIANNFDKLSDEVRVISIKTALLLLQDEDEDIRNLCVNYYKNIKKLAIAVHPNICLNKILDRKFLQQIFSDTQMTQVLCEDILNFVSRKLHNIDVDNPFANDSKNIYLEVNVLKGLIENL
ncbi:putative cell cycle-associated protein [Operophtera brumata]|uniref:Putative cell cycle-associated protein n=1 Tax=Operophtera brumata TaxID=104452 RepID=A0A0L7L139_OPEBR|nr:putative cell cycle-associated protein [Operophtera brumata]